MQRPAAASHRRWPQVRERNRGPKKSSRYGLKTWSGLIGIIRLVGAVGYTSSAN